MKLTHLLVTMGMVTLMACSTMNTQPAPTLTPVESATARAEFTTGITQGITIACCGWHDAEENNVYRMSTKWKSVRGKGLQPYKGECIARKPVNGISTGFQCKKGSYTREQIAELGRTQ